MGISNQNLINDWIVSSFSKRDVLLTSVWKESSHSGSLCEQEGLVRKAFDHNHNHLGYIITKNGWELLASLVRSNRTFDEVQYNIAKSYDDNGVMR